MLGRHDDEQVAELLHALVRHLTKASIEVLAPAALAHDLDVERVDESSIANDADLVIAIGGDGTMLYAAKIAGGRDVPLLGINRGRLGFLADVSPDEMVATVDQILAGQYAVESRLMLDAVITHADGERVTATALNDIVLQRRDTGRMLDVVARLDGQYVNTHSGDGLIVATPTGSTAYSLSCGGPIVEPGLEAIVIAPICPHTLTDRPIVIPSTRRIDLKILEREDTSAEVVVDGHSIGAIEPDGELSVTMSPYRARLIHPPGYDFFGLLRSKLFWGRDSRVRNVDV